MHPQARSWLDWKRLPETQDNLYHLLVKRGYALCLLHPRQTHQFAQQRGLRAKTDKLDASTIARVLLGGEARAGYVPTEVVATYRELVRLQAQLSDEAARYKNEIHALLVVLFPEFTQVAVRSQSTDSLGLAEALSQSTSHRGSWGAESCLATP